MLSLDDFHITEDDEDYFHCKVEFCLKEIDLCIGRDVDDIIMNNQLFIANELLRNQIEWNNRVRRYVANYILTHDLQRTWGDKEYTAHELEKMLQLECIAVSKEEDEDEGSFTFTFDDDIIFKYHSTGKHEIFVDGNLKDGLNEVDIQSYGSTWP